jgi:hypothetical protein
MKIIPVLAFFFCNALCAQNIAEVYPVSDFDPNSVWVKDSNIVVLNPLPFEITYLIEFSSNTRVSKVLVDRKTDAIKLSAFVDGSWVYFDMDDQQAFNVNQTVRYLMVRYKEDYDSVYLLIVE